LVVQAIANGIAGIIRHESAAEELLFRQTWPVNTMENQSELRPGDNIQDGFDGFERRLPENRVEYMLFVIESQLESRKTPASLEAVRKAAVALSSELTNDHIWQREKFQLDAKSKEGMYDSPRHPGQTPLLVQLPESWYDLD
jgi:hypothetical protein